MGVQRDFPGSTILQCQMALCKEMERLTKDWLFQNADAKGPEKVRLKIYEQNLPIKKNKVPNAEDAEKDTIEFRQADVEDAIVQCPWCNVKLDRAWNDGPNSKTNAKFAVIFGIYNDDEVYSGHRETLNLMALVKERFLKNPLLDSQYYCTNHFDEQVNEEEVYPYTFGVITLVFEIAQARRESEYV